MAVILGGLVGCDSPTTGIDAGPTQGDDASMDAASAPVDSAVCPDDCDDGLFCNGVEACEGGACAEGEPPCAATECDEDADTCACDEPDQDGDGRDAIACGGDDCDDADPNRFPGNTEVCDPDDHDEDCNPATFGDLDLDGDLAHDVACCNGDSCGTDCDDANPTVHPTASEVCDGLDNDCGGDIDEGVLRTFYPDADGDGFGLEGGTPAMACVPPAAHSETVGDCDDDPDTGSAIHPGAPEVCDPAMIDNDCNGVPNDGCTCVGSETRPCVLTGICANGQETCLDGVFGECSIQPQPETCDMVDQDCNGIVDDGATITCYLDVDDDGYAATGALSRQLCEDVTRASVGGCPAGYTDRPPLTTNIDCDDAHPLRSPGTAEVCNGFDEDCDGIVDDGVTVTCYPDSDSDTFPAGFGGASQQCPAMDRPAVGLCPVEYTNTPPGPGTTDCAPSSPDVFPGATELCNDADDDCDGVRDEGTTVDCYADVDGDTYAAAGAVRQSLCPDPARPAHGECRDGYTNRVPGGLGTVDCDDLTPSRSPDVTETCNTIDDDCDGMVNEGTTVTCYVDTDGDTYAAAGAAAQLVCPDPARTAVGECPVNYTDRAPSGVGSVDCNDLDGTRSPAVTEICNGIDDDCDGGSDEGTTVTCFLDSDGDTYAPASATALSLCPDDSRPEVGRCRVGYTHRSPASGSDCDDARPTVNPGVTESRCDGLDDNCNGTIDEEMQTRYYRDADNDLYGNSSISVDRCSQPSGYVTDNTDCNDSLSSIHPGAPELCNCVDDDCDMVADDSLPTVCVWRDTDGDDHGDASSAGCDAMRCLPPTGPLCDPVFARAGGDCNDSNSAIHPGAADACVDGIDDDCSGVADDGAQTWYFDFDRDGYGDDSITMPGCMDPGPDWVLDGGDCDDTRASVRPNAPELCDGRDTDCSDVAGAGEVANSHGLNHPLEDNDDDGHGDLACPTPPMDAVLDDCDDDDGLTYLGATEIVGNGVDNDCSGGTEICFRDQDSDGHRHPVTTMTVVSSDADCDDMGEGHLSEPADDCNDASSAVHPDAAEIVGNEIDNDCDGGELCYEDGDDDGFSRSDSRVLPSADADCQDGAEATAALPRTDCNDADASVSPADLDTMSMYVGNHVDNDCDGREVCWVDADSDNYRAIGTATILSTADVDCLDAGEGAASEPATDCNDSVATINPGATEVVGDGVDQNCIDGELCYLDNDNDGHRLTTTLASADADCDDAREAYATEPADDCDDGNGSRYPGNLDTVGVNIANGVDNDCNGGEVCYLDNDNDGHRVTATLASADADCNDTREALASEPADDCDDSNGARYPGNLDTNPGNIGNGVDNDCNGGEICYLDNDDDGHRVTATLASTDADCNDTREALASEPADDCDDNNGARYPGNSDSAGGNIANGVDNDCDGGEICYSNVDGDGYRTAVTRVSANASCGDASEAYSWQASGDCCDFDSRVFPGQTMWFTSGNSCGGFDYNCNSVENRRWTSNATACGPRVGGVCVDYGGWSGTGAIPTCTESRTFQTGCRESGVSLCLPETESGRHQECR